MRIESESGDRSPRREIGVGKEGKRSQTGAQFGSKVRERKGQKGRGDIRSMREGRDKPRGRKSTGDL